MFEYTHLVVDTEGDGRQPESKRSRVRMPEA